MDGNQQLDLMNTDRSRCSRSPSYILNLEINTAPEMGSALSTPEPSMFSVVNRGGISPSPFAYRPLPPIKTSSEESNQAEKENEFQIHRKIREEERQRAVKERTERGLQVILPHEMKLLAEKHGMESNLKTAKDSMISEYINSPCQVLAPKSQKPSSQQKGYLVVRDTKASRLRKKLQMENGQAVKSPKALPPVKVPVKLPARTSMAKTNGQMFRSPTNYSRSSSESLPSTPSDPGPPRPDYVLRLDLPFLLSPDDYPKGDPIPPPEFVVRETKASRLRLLKKLEDEIEAKRRENSEKLKDMAFYQPYEKFRRKNSLTAILKQENFGRSNSTPQSGREMGGKRQASELNIEEQWAERGQETLDKSVRSRMFRMEMARGLKVRKEIRSAMEEDEERWKKDLLKEFEEIESPYVFGKPEDNNKHIVIEALSILRERLEELEATDNNTAKSKLNSYFRKKLKIFFKKKEKALQDEQEYENMKKEKEEKIDEYFRRTVKSINGVLSDVWERFINQQDVYQEMLKKITLQEEMLEKWKSDARHYRFMHAMLKKDYLEGRMESWYLNKD